MLLDILKAIAMAAVLTVAAATPSTALYWNVFNIEGESSLGAQTVTYGTLADMLNDANRTGVFTLGSLAPQNVVGSGAVVPISAPSPVPVPAVFPIFAAVMGLFGFVGWRRRRRAAAVA